MGFLWVIVKAILKKFAELLQASMPPELRKPIDFIAKLKKPFNFLGTNTKEKQAAEKGIKGLIKRIMKMILKKFVSILKIIGKFCVACAEPLLIVLAVVLIGVMLTAILGAFGAFNGRIAIEFDKFEELNADESIYMDAQNTNELRKAYMQLVSETSYYQVFNLRDLNPNSMNPYLEVMAKVVNKLYDWGLTDTEVTQIDLNYYNMSRTFLGWVTQDERYIYSDANKNALKYMKLPKVTGIGVDVGDLVTTMNTVNDNFRDYYNRETTFQISENLLSEMNRILFGEFSNVETITYPEAFVKPVAFVNDFYRIQDTGRYDNIGKPYVYVTQRVTLRDINNMSSFYYEKDWLEGIIKSEPSHIVYDYVVEQKNNYYWSEADNDLATQMAWGNIGKYATVTEEIEYEDGTTVDKESAMKLYWRVIDTDKTIDSGKPKGEDGNNPYNEHMGISITNKNYTTYFDGPYTRLNSSPGSVSIDTTSKICDNGKAVVYVNPENGNESDTYHNGWVKVRCEYNKYPLRHMQLVSIFDENGEMQVNSRVLFNKTFVQKKSVRDSYRYFPEYFSEFENFANTDLERMAPAVGLEALFPSSDTAIENGTGSCTQARYDEDLKKPFSERKCSIIRRYTGTNGWAYVKAKFTEWGQGISNFFTGEDTEAEINVSSEAMFYLLLAYDDYIIETGEYGVAWDYKYYTETQLDLEFRKAQFRDIFGFKEIFVDSWNDTAVYKDTLDTVKALDNQRTVSTTYVPTSIISGQSSLCKDQSGKCNNNNNNSGYGWKIGNDASSAGAQTLERVKGEASLEAPKYSTGSLIEIIKKYLANGVYYGPDDFRFSYDSAGDIIDSGDKSWENYISGLDNNISDDKKVKDESGNNISVEEALKAYNEGGDWRNTTEAWDPYAKIYRPTNSESINTKITSGITTINNGGRVSYKTYQGDYLPYETKSVRDYGLGSVLSYIQDMRVVYQTGVYMDETYVGKGNFETAFKGIVDASIASNFGKAGNGYYPKELLDKYPELTESLRSTPIPVEDLMSLAQNIVSLQYAATDYEMDEAEKAAGDGASYEAIRDELVKIIAGRNMDGIYIGDNNNTDGFPLISASQLDTGVKGDSTNICESAYDKCKDIDEEAQSEYQTCVSNRESNCSHIHENDEDGLKLCMMTQQEICDEKYNEKKEELKSCLLEKQDSGMYFNEGLFDCERKCETEAMTSARAIHPDFDDEERAAEESRINDKKNKCLEICKNDWPDLSQVCAYDADISKLAGVYAYGPYLKDTYWESFKDKLFGWFLSSANTYSQIQFLDPLQYYIEWFDFKAEDEDSIISKALHFITGEEFVTEIHVAGSAYLQSIKNNNTGFASVSVDQHFLNIGSDFAGAGVNIVGEFKQDFYNQYGQDLEPMNLILENESYRIYMIDEAVTFLGTFTYTYKNDIANIGGGMSDRQVSGLAYADRYYYLSNYIFNIPTVKYKAKQMGSAYTKSAWYSAPSCNSYGRSDAKEDVKGSIFSSFIRWISGEATPDVLDAGVISKSTYVMKYKSKTCHTPRVCVDGVCTGGTPYECGGYEQYWTTTCKNYASVETVQDAKDGYIIDTPAKIKTLINSAKSLNSNSDLKDKVYIGIKIYDSLSDWSWSFSVNNSTDIDKKFSHDYNEDYLSLSTSAGVFGGDTDNHYQNFKDVNDNIAARSGYKVHEDEIENTDDVKLPDDLHMSVDIDNGLVTPNKLTENDLLEIYKAAEVSVPFTVEPDSLSVGGGDWTEIKLDGGHGLIKEDKYKEIGVGLFLANRESYGYPIPLFRHFAGVMREILPRQRGYYFNGEVFDSWNSRLILTENTTPAQKAAILDEKNKTQSYLYDYIMNFETYVPMDVKSDYDLMSRARDAYHSTMSTKVNHVENTAVLSSDIYNIANSDAWKETIKKFGSEMDATTVSQLVSGLLEVSIDRAPRKMITVLNQNITVDDKKIVDSTANRSVIENAINASINGGSSILGAGGGTANFNNTLFLGDSQTKGMEDLGLFSGTGATVNAVVGRGISATNDAAKGYSGYSTVFINIGVNDATNADSTFKTHYTTLINTVKSKNPGATIYIGSIPGINDTEANGVTVVRNADVVKKNKVIQQLAADMGVNFIDVYSHLGTMDASDTKDGLHLEAHKYRQWFDFMAAYVGTSSGSSALDVTLTLEDGSSQTFRLTDLGPGVIFYDYNNHGGKTISTSDIHVSCGAGTEYTVCFDDVSINISDTIDERMDKNKSLQYVATKLGKLIQKYGDVKYAILAYFHGEGYATAVQAKGEGGTWFNGDDADKIADILAELTGDESVRMNADNINTFMYSGQVVTEVMGYIQDTANKTVLNNAAVIPAAAAGVPLGTNKDFPMDVYTKWQPLFDTFCAKYEVDVALAVAMFTQESAGNAFAGLCSDDSIGPYIPGATPICTGLNTGKYNGGGGIGQIHHICDSGSGKKNLDNGGTCTRTITSQKKGDTVVVNMANPKYEVSSINDMSAFLAKDDRYGNVEKAFEWAIILLSNLLNESNNDAFLAAARYNGWPSGCSLTDPNWYTCYSSKRNEYTKYPDYVKHIARYYVEELATAELTTNFGVSGATGAASFGLQTGNLSYQRDMFQIQNSGIELYIPRMTTSRDDVTTLILNVSNFGKEDYYMYANEHNLLSFFTERLEDGNDSANSMLGGNPMISQLGKKSSRSVNSDYKFAYMTPLIPLQSPISTQTNSDQLNVTSEFGNRNKIDNDVPTNEIAMHNGVDLGYVDGTGILAAAEGRVSIAQYHISYGNYVEIEHTVPANTVVTDSSGTRYQIVGLYTRYAHMTHYTVNVGDVIRSSCSSNTGGGKCLTLTDEIGYVGNTGNSTGNHLHFEVIVKARNLDTGELLPETAANTKCDPYYWLTTKWTQGASLVDGALTDAEVNTYIETIKSYYPNLSITREKFLRNALSLVGKVRYYFGGESTAYGWDPQWGTPAPTSNQHYQRNLAKGRTIWGLDCSEFIQWVYRNTFNEEYADGVTGQWNMANEGAGKVNISNPQPGDLGVTSDLGHIGIYLYTNDSGQKVYVHCGDPVKVEPYSKFVKFFTINKLGQ